MPKRKGRQQIRGKVEGLSETTVDPGMFDPVLDAISSVQSVLNVPFLIRIQLSCTSSAKIETDPQEGKGSATASNATNGMSDADAQLFARLRAERRAEDAAKRELQRQVALITCASPCTKIIVKPTTKIVGQPSTTTETSFKLDPVTTLTRYETTVQAVAKTTVKCARRF